MKKIIIAGVAAVLIGGGAYGYQRHQRTELVTSISPAIKNASIRIGNSSKFETEKSSITYKELFERTDSDINEIEKRSIDIQSIANKNNAEITTPAVDYLRTCEEFSRALAMKYRKQLAFSNALDHANDALRDFDSSTYGYEFSKKRRDRAVEEMKKAAEESNNADANFLKIVEQLKVSRSKLAAIVPDDTLVQVSQLEGILAKASGEQKEQKDKKEQKTVASK